MTTANYRDLPCLSCDSAGSVDLRIAGEHVETIICPHCDGSGYLVAKQAAGDGAAKCDEYDEAAHDTCTQCGQSFV